ncbi:putative adenylyl-sulfate kinase [Helianthus debilis subsp. tardiflorus]
MPNCREVAKLFSDAGVICISSVISPYRKKIAILVEPNFRRGISLRDLKGLYKLTKDAEVRFIYNFTYMYKPKNLLYNTLMHKNTQSTQGTRLRAQKNPKYALFLCFVEKARLK